MENLEVFGARKFSNLELDIDNIIEVLQYIKEPISLESSIDGKYELKEYIEDVNSMTPFEIVYYITLMEKLNDLIKKLKLNEQIVIKMKFGIDSGKEYTFKEIARHLGISCERVRQILNSALAHLKSEMIKNELI
jgi:RNA polymerase primary sigma factor